MKPGNQKYLGTVSMHHIDERDNVTHTNIEPKANMNTFILVQLYILLKGPGTGISDSEWNARFSAMVTSDDGHTQKLG
jgi:hypothetical protein